MSKVWLVTGSASGLGRNITEAVLASGARLVATARDPRRLDDVVKKYGDQVRTASLDVADENAANLAVQAAVDAFGRLDVVVNNAGYGDIAPFEQLSSERFKAVVDTNFYGVVNVTRGPAPHFRSCVSRRAGASFRFLPWVGVWPGPAARRITPPNGQSGDLPNPLPRRWLRSAYECARSNLVECGQTGAPAPMKKHLTCSRIMSRQWALSLTRCAPTGAGRRAIRSKWPK